MPDDYAAGVAAMREAARQMLEREAECLRECVAEAERAHQHESAALWKMALDSVAPLGLRVHKLPMEDEC